MLIKNLQSNQLTFSDFRFYVNEDGNYYPSVTTVLEAYPKSYALLQWMKEMGSKADEIRDAAGRRGSSVHLLTEDYDRGIECTLLDTNGKPKYSIDEWSMFERYVEFATIHTPENSLIEQTIISGKLGFAGTIDRICVIDGKRYVLDVKTSNSIHNSYWLQLAAYRELYLSMADDMPEIDGVAIIWLNAKTRTYGKNGSIQGPGWQLLSQDSTVKEWGLFQAVHKLWNAEHSDDKPREFSYQLTHKKN